jgi:hypothetical protein
MIYKKSLIFVIGKILSDTLEIVGAKKALNADVVFIGTDEGELKNYNSGKKLIVNKSIPDFYIDTSILFINQNEFENLGKAVVFLMKNKKRIFIIFEINDPLSLAVTPIIAQSVEKIDGDSCFIGFNLFNNSETGVNVCEENLKYFLKNRYRLYLIEKEGKTFSLKANEENAKNEFLMSLIDSLVKEFKQADLSNL